VVEAIVEMDREFGEKAGRIWLEHRVALAIPVVLNTPLFE
jgi:hypothetical protein